MFPPKPITPVAHPSSTLTSLAKNIISGIFSFLSYITKFPFFPGPLLQIQICTYFFYLKNTQNKKHLPVTSLLQPLCHFSVPLCSKTQCKSFASIYPSSTLSLRPCLSSFHPCYSTKTFTFITQSMLSSNAGNTTTLHFLDFLPPSLAAACQCPLMVSPHLAKFIKSMVLFFAMSILPPVKISSSPIVLNSI